MPSLCLPPSRITLGRYVYQEPASNTRADVLPMKFRRARTLAGTPPGLGLAQGAELAIRGP